MRIGNDRDTVGRINLDKRNAELDLKELLSNLNILCDNHNENIHLCSNSHSWKNVEIQHNLNISPPLSSPSFKVCAQQCKRCNFWKKIMVQGVDCRFGCLKKEMGPDEERRLIVSQKKSLTVRNATCSSYELHHNTNFNAFIISVIAEINRFSEDCSTSYQLLFSAVIYCPLCHRIICFTNYISFPLRYINVDSQMYRIFTMLLAERLTRLTQEIKYTNIQHNETQDIIPIITNEVLNLLLSDDYINGICKINKASAYIEISDIKYTPDELLDTAEINGIETGTQQYD